MDDLTFRQRIESDAQLRTLLLAMVNFAIRNAANKNFRPDMMNALENWARDNGLT